MTIRVSTQGLYLQSLGAMQLQQLGLAETQLQVASGRRFQTAADDPVAAARELDLNRSLRRLDQLESNRGVAEHRLSLEDAALGEVTDTLQRVRELALTINTDTNDGSGQVISTEVDELLNHLVQLANSSDGEGGFLFSGFSSRAQPFVREGDSVSYRGDQGQRFLQIGPDRRIADGDSGAEVFQFVRNGNGTFTTRAVATNTGTAVVGEGALVDANAWVPGTYKINFTSPTDYEVTDGGGTVIASGTYNEAQAISFNGIEVDISGEPQAGDSFGVEASTNQDIFTALQDLVDVARTSPAGPAQRAIYHSDINSVLSNLDQALEHISVMRTRVGTRLAAVDDQGAINSDNELALQTTLSGVRDVDFIEAASRMELQRVSLQAAQQAFVRTQNLSLFRLLG
ncbi:MAG: flagellar hook-associated protein FlgL, partial [Gammaproteobacteria bacterium]|nr:flagellar hook-associated protein FlgL [Gammaproteobacteria bacterium]